MKLGEKIYKAISYGFIVFIVALIVLTFGMPEFMGKAGQSEMFLSARVGDEVVTRKEVQNLKENMLRMPQFQNFASQDEFLTGYALDYLVSEKLQVISQKESGMYPLSDAKSAIVARYLKKNFKEFQTNEGFDFSRFEKEFLKPRRLSFVDIESQAVRENSFQNRQIFDKLESVSGYELADMHLLKNTKISYDILVFTPDDKKRLIKSMVGVTEKDIQEKFAKDYLSKDKKDTLNDLKREAITQSLINERRSKVEKDWMNNLKTDAKTSTLAQLKQKYGGALVTLNNIGLTESIAQASKNPGVNLGLLENSPDYLSRFALYSAEKNQGPWNIEDNLFLVCVTNIARPADELSEKNAVDYESEIKNKNKNSVDQLVEAILKRDAKVKKFNPSEE